MGMEGTVNPRNKKRGFGAAMQLVETTKDLPTLHGYQPPVQPAGKLEKPKPVSVGPYIMVSHDSEVSTNFLSSLPPSAAISRSSASRSVAGGVPKQPPLSACS